eukprot:gb/GECH01010394.1/.p1 GENE.gb/GECH01010394.1/~~gb/GECH01010394.1/.p1  ORF type:complete len:409 (+),score=66.28 gb/GECH01010394.1/:1-1227(+)
MKQEEGSYWNTLFQRYEEALRKLNTNYSSSVKDYILGYRDRQPKCGWKQLQQESETISSFAFHCVKRFILDDMNYNGIPKYYRCGSTQRIDQFLKATRYNPLIIASLPGNGKSHLFSVMANMAVKRGIFPILINHLVELEPIVNRTEEAFTLIKEIMPLLSPSILILDDFNDFRLLSESGQCCLLDMLDALQHKMQTDSSLDMRIICSDHAFVKNESIDFLNKHGFDVPILPMTCPNYNERQALLYKYSFRDDSQLRSAIFGNEENEIIEEATNRLEGIDRAGILHFMKDQFEMKPIIKYANLSDYVRLETQNGKEVLTPSSENDPDAIKKEQFLNRYDLIFEQLSTKYFRECNINPPSHSLEDQQQMINKCKQKTSVMWPYKTVFDHDFLPPFVAYVASMFNEPIKL